jgi:hypothetical protein
VVAHKVGKMKEERGWNQPIWVLKEVHHQHERASNGLGSKGHLKALSSETLGGLAQRSCEDSSLEAKLASWTCVAQVPRLR